MAYWSLLEANRNESRLQFSKLTLNNLSPDLSNESLRVKSDGHIEGDLFVDGTIYGAVSGGNTFVRAYPTPVINVGSSSGAGLRHFRVNPTPEPTCEVDMPWHVTNTATATDTLTGALLVDGGTSIQQDLYVGGTIHGNIPQIPNVTITSTTESTSTDTGAIICAGGVGIAKNLYVGGDAHILGTTYMPNLVYEQQEIIDSTIDSTSISTGASVVYGGMGIAKDLYVGGTIHGNISVPSSSIIFGTDQSTSTDSGALIVPGGVGIGKNLNVGGQSNITNTATQLTLSYDVTNNTTFTVSATGDMNINASGNDLNLNATDRIHVLNTLQSSDVSSGSLQLSGGLGIVKNCNIGGVTRVYATTVASDSLTGALIVDGGIGVKGTSHFDDLRVDTQIIGTSGSFSFASVTNTSDSTSSTTGSFLAFGGVGIAKNLNIGGQTKITNTAAQLSLNYDATNATTFTINSGGDLFIDSSGNDVSFNVTDKVSVLATTQSTNITTGSLVVNGGLGVAKDVFCGGAANIVNTTTGVYISPLKLECDNATSTLIHIGQSNNNARNKGYVSFNFTSDQSTSNYMGLNLQSGTTFAVYGDNVKYAGIINAQNTTQANTTTQGAIICSGGVGIAKNLFANAIYSSTVSNAQNFNVDNTTNQGYINFSKWNIGTEPGWQGVNLMRYLDTGSTLVSTSSILSNNTTGDMTYSSGSGKSTFSDTTQATDSLTGSLVCSGGVGISKNLYVGGIFELTTPPTQEVGGVFASLQAGGANLVLFRSYFRAWGFQNGVSQSVFYQVEIPHGAAKTVVTPHMHWSKVAVGTGDVHWLHYYTISNNQGGFVDQTPTAYIGYTIAVPANTNEPMMSNFADIDISGMSDPIIVHGRVERVGGDAADTYGDDVLLHAFGYHFYPKRLGE